MTKQEAITKTEYTEEELINLALQFAVCEMRKFRDAASDENDIESWEHYENLRNAFAAIYEERMAN